MGDQRNLNDAIFDAALVHALGDIAEQEEQQAEELFEALAKEAETVTTSKKFDREMHRLVRQAGKSNVRSFPTRIMRIAATIVVVLGVSTAMVTITTKASIADLFAWAFDRNDIYMSMEDIRTFERQCASQVFALSEMEYFYYPQNIAEGYQLDEIVVYDNYNSIYFIKGESSINFSQMILDREGAVSFSGTYDTEDAKVRVVNIDGQEAHLVSKENKIIIFYSNNDYYFDFSFVNVSKANAIKFASNLKKIRK